MKLRDTDYNFSVDNAVVVVGKHPILPNYGDFHPSIHSEKWGGECFLRLTSSDTVITSDEIAGNGFLIAGMKRKGKKELHQWKSGSLEWTIQWKTRQDAPDNLQVAFDMDFPDGLDFFKQEALSQSELDRGISRPDDVINSYACYWKKSNNQYETGKFCHIYRPKLIDADGKYCWCDQLIAGNQLIVYLDSDFMNSAVYPITLDPTLGYTSAGASNYVDISGYYAGGGDYTMPEAGTVASIAVYLQSVGASVNATMSIWQAVTNPYDTIRSVTAGATVANGWNTQNLAAYTLVNGANYGMEAYAGSGGAVMRYDTGTGGSPSGRYYKQNIWGYVQGAMAAHGGLLNGDGSGKMSIYLNYNQVVTNAPNIFGEASDSTGPIYHGG